MTDPEIITIRSIQFMQPSQIQPGDVMHSILINPMFDLDVRQMCAMNGIYQSSILLTQELVMDVQTEEVVDPTYIPAKNVSTLITTDSGNVTSFIDDRNYLVGIMRTDPFQAVVVN